MRHNKMPTNLNIYFLEVVQQHILGVVENITHRFVGNLTGFPATAKVFRKSVKI